MNTETYEVLTTRNEFIGLIQSAVMTRRPALLMGAGRTDEQKMIADIIINLICVVRDYEDYKRRVEFTMACMEGDCKGFLGKIKAVQYDQPNPSGDGFEKAPQTEDDNADK